MKAVATCNEIAGNGVRFAVFVVGHAGVGAVKVMHHHVVGFVNRGQPFVGAVGHQIAGDFGLSVDHHLFPACVPVQVNAVAFACKQQLKAVMHQAFLMHAFAHADFVQQIHGDLFEHTGADTSQHIVAALSLQDDGVDACFVQQCAQQQPGRSCADDDDLCPHVCLLCDVRKA